MFSIKCILLTIVICANASLFAGESKDRRLVAASSSSAAAVWDDDYNDDEDPDESPRWDASLLYRTVGGQRIAKQLILTDRKKGKPALLIDPTTFDLQAIGILKAVLSDCATDDPIKDFEAIIPYLLQKDSPAQVYTLLSALRENPKQLEDFVAKLSQHALEYLTRKANYCEIDSILEACTKEYKARGFKGAKDLPYDLQEKIRKKGIACDQIIDAMCERTRPQCIWISENCVPIIQIEPFLFGTYLKVLKKRGGFDIIDLTDNTNEPRIVFPDEKPLTFVGSDRNFISIEHVYNGEMWWGNINYHNLDKGTITPIITTPLAFFYSQYDFFSIQSNQSEASVILSLAQQIIHFYPETGDCDMVYQLQQNERFTSTIFSESENAILAISNKKRLYIYNLATKKIERILNSQGDLEFCAAKFTLDGNAVTIASEKGIFIYNLSENKTDTLVALTEGQHLKSAKLDLTGTAYVYHTEDRDIVIGNINSDSSVNIGYKLEESESLLGVDYIPSKDNTLISTTKRLLLYQAETNNIEILLEEPVTFMGQEKGTLLFTNQRHVLIYQNEYDIHTIFKPQHNESVVSAKFIKPEKAVLISTDKRVLRYSLQTNRLIDSGFRLFPFGGYPLSQTLYSEATGDVFIVNGPRLLKWPQRCPELENLSPKELKFIKTRCAPAWLKNRPFRATTEKECEMVEQISTYLPNAEHLFATGKTAQLIAAVTSWWDKSW